MKRENTAFFQLVHRLHRKVRRTIASVNGEPVPPVDDPEDQIEIGAPEEPKEAGARQKSVRTNDTALLFTENAIVNIIRLEECAT